MNYSSEVLQRFGLPQADGAFPDETEGVVRGEAEDRSLGIWIRFDVQVRDGLIQAVRFQLFGCPHAIAAASLICERFEGKPARALAAIDLQAVAGSLDLPVEKYGKLLVIEDALLACRQALGRSQDTSGARKSCDEDERRTHGNGDFIDEQRGRTRQKLP